MEKTRTPGQAGEMMSINSYVIQKKSLKNGVSPPKKNSAPSTQKASRVTSVAKHWVTKYFSEALKILRRPHKVTVNHLRPFPTSMYRVRGEHLRGIEIVAPATQNPCLR